MSSFSFSLSLSLSLSLSFSFSFVSASASVGVAVTRVVNGADPSSGGSVHCGSVLGRVKDALASLGACGVLDPACAPSLGGLPSVVGGRNSKETL